MDEEEINDLLKDVKIDKERVKKSIYTVLRIYGLSLNDVVISRRELDSSLIFVAAVEECDLEKAKGIMKEKYPGILPAPITVLEYKGKSVLFMGSNRSVIFTLKDRKPDCIIVKLPDNIKEPLIVSNAEYTLKEIIDRQRRNR